MKVMVIVKATADSEAGIMPTEQEFAEMGQFNEELVKAGIMLAGDGLHPSAKGYRVRFSGQNRIVTDGPFTETKELIAGYWIWQVKSIEEAVSWARRCPIRCRAKRRSSRSVHFRGGRFRRRIHAGAARQGRSSARRDRTTAEAVDSGS